MRIDVRLQNGFGKYSWETIEINEAKVDSELIDVAEHIVESQFNNKLKFKVIEKPTNSFDITVETKHGTHKVIFHGKENYPSPLAGLHYLHMDREQEIQKWSSKYKEEKHKQVTIEQL